MSKRRSMVGTFVLVAVAACGSSSASPGDADGSDGGASNPAAEAGTSPGGGVTPGDGGGTCLGSALLTALGKKEMLVGGSMQSATQKLAPFDVQYIYISGGAADGSGPCASCATGCSAMGKTCASSGGGCAWWGCYQYDQVAPGAFVRDFDTSSRSLPSPAIPMFTYYQILQTSGVAEGVAEATQAATNQSTMARYFADFRFLLQQIGDTQAILHLEPDFWGFAQQNGGHVSSDPTSQAAAVASANPTDCGSEPNTIAGMGACMISMVRKYAPKAFVGLHASAWSTNQDAAGNKDPSFDVAAEAKKTAAYLSACGESQADFVVVETSDRDAGYYQTVEGKMVAWDAENATLPDFHQDFAWVKALTEALGKPALFWQTPLGNASGNNTKNHYQDNRVDYFFTHMSELATAHAIGAMYGAGAGDQTQPETDGNNFVDKAKAYYQAGGQGLCQ